MSESIGWKGKALRVVKSALCVMLCCVMVFAYSYKKPTEAHATPVVAVVGAVAVAAAAAALGICVNGVVNNETYAQSCQRIWDNMDDGIKRKVTMAAVVAVGAGNAVGNAAAAQYNLTSEFLTAVGAQIKTAYDIATASDSLSSNFSLPLYNATYNKSFSTLFSSLGFYKARNGETYFDNDTNVISYSILGTLSVIPNDYSTFTNSAGDSISIRAIYGEHTGKIERISRIINGELCDPWTWWTTEKYGFGVIIAYDVLYKGTVQTRYIIYNGLDSLYNTILWASTAGDTICEAPGHDVYGIPGKDVYADGYSALNHTVSDVVDKVGNAVGVLNPDGTKTIPVSVPTTGVTTQTQTQTQSSTLDKDIADTASKEANDTTNKGKNTAPPKLPGLPDLSLPTLLTKKFPFCIPFDIYAIVSGFYCAEMKAPHWEIPVVNKRYGWNWKIVLDWSQFEPVAVVCRWFTGAAWVFALILVTRKLIGAGGGD